MLALTKTQDARSAAGLFQSLLEHFPCGCKSLAGIPKRARHVIHGTPGFEPEAVMRGGQGLPYGQDLRDRVLAARDASWCALWRNGFLSDGVTGRPPG